MKRNVLIVILLTSLVSCWEKSPTDRIQPTAEDRQVYLQFKRFDAALFGSEKPSVRSLMADFGTYTCDYAQLVLNADCTTSQADSMLLVFRQDAIMQQAHRDIESTFPPSTISEIQTDLNEAFQRFHAMFPQRTMPKVFFTQSGWSTNVFATDSILSISLESYLGPENPGIQNIPVGDIPEYYKEDMRSEYLVADACLTWAKKPVEELHQGEDLLSTLIDMGKALYISECMIPDVSDEAMLKWTPEELSWAEQNEYEVWKILAHQDVLYDNRQREIVKWFNAGPFTGVDGIPQGSPPQLGQWIGWRMVHQFMAKSDTYTIDMLLQEKDKQKILAAYVPKRKS